jgi:hypothetical protein
MLVALAIGMYTSYNFARTVYEKIQLQNAADAAAYSLAAQEARSFNFIAFSNRALIAKQVQLLELHAEVSESTYSVGMLGYLGDIFQTYGGALMNPVNAAFFPSAYAAGQLMKQVGVALETLHTQLAGLLDAKLVALEAALKSEPAFSTLYFAMSAALAGSTAARVAEGAPDIVAANDSSARLHPLSYAFNAYNVATYLKAFDTDSLTPGVDSRRAFTEAVHASRYAAGGRPEKLVWRAGLMSELTGGLAMLRQLTGEKSIRKRSKGVAGEIGDFANSLADTQFTGTTKVLAKSGSDQADLDDTGSSADERSFLSPGEVMTSKDVRTGFLLPALSADDGRFFASLRSGRSGFTYCRYEKPDAYGTGGFLRLPAILSSARAAGFTCDSTGVRQDLRYRGIGRFFRFEADAGATAGGGRGFNQPSVWVFLNKSPEESALGDGDDLNFALRRGASEARLDARIGEDGVLGTGVLRGVNAISRAQVYYHRPGAWQEPPNFFNPYWGARLAPKAVATDTLLGNLGLSGFLADFFSDNTMMF